MSDGFNGAIPAHPTTIPVDVEVEQGTDEVGGRPHGRFEIEQEELEDPEKGIDLNAAYPSKLSVQWPDGEVISCNAGPLYRVISEMGKSLEQQGKEIARPQWLPSLLQQVEKAGDLQQKFLQLTSMTSELMKLTKESPATVRLEGKLNAMIESFDKEDEIPPAIESKFTEISNAMGEIQARVAICPSVAEISQIRDIITERAKKLKAQLSEKQLATEKKYDVKLGSQLNRLQDWENKMDKLVRSRFSILDDHWETTNRDLENFRIMLDQKIQDAQTHVAVQTGNVMARQGKIDERMDGLDATLRGHADRARELGDEDQELHSKCNKIRADLTEFQTDMQKTLEAHHRHLDSLQTDTNQHKAEIHDHARLLQDLRNDSADHMRHMKKHDGDLKGKGVQIEDHENRIQKEEEISAKVNKDIKGIKRDADERQQYLMSKIDEVGARVATEKKRGDSLQSQCDELRADLTPLEARVEQEAKRLVRNEAVVDNHGENLASINKAVGFMKSKVQLFDAITGNIVDMQDKISSQDAALDTQKSKLQEIEAKTKDCEKSVKHQSRANEQIKAHMDEEFDEVKRDAAQSKLSIDQLEEELKMMQDAHEDFVSKVESRNQKPEVGEKTGANLSDEERQIIYDTNVQALAEIYARFEKMVVSKRKVTVMSEKLARQLGGMAMEVAEFINTNVNLRSIMTQVRLGPEDAPLTNEGISQFRENDLQTYLTDLKAQIEHNSRGSDDLKSCAQTEFLKQAKVALDMAISRFDQVVVPADSMISRQAIPMCVACDRPLPGKRREKDLYGTVVGNQAYNGIAMYEILEHDTASVELSETSHERPMPKKVPRPATAPSASESITIPSMQGALPVMSRTASDLAPTVVYRSGFRMPHQDPASAELPRLSGLIGKSTGTPQWRQHDDPRALRSDDPYGNPL